MKIGLYENYKFTNLSVVGGGSSSTPPPGHTEANKLRKSTKELGGGGGSTSSKLPPAIRTLIKILLNTSCNILIYVHIYFFMKSFFPYELCLYFCLIICFYFVRGFQSPIEAN